MRTGSIIENNLYLETGSIIKFGNLDTSGKEALIPLSMSNPESFLSVGDILRIDFNSAVVQLTEIVGSIILARVIKGGKVGGNKGIHIDRQIELPSFTNKDISAFKISKKLGVDTFFLSFCSNSEDVVALRNGQECEDSRCSVVSNISDDYFFNVTGFTN